MDDYAAEKLAWISGNSGQAEWEIQKTISIAMPGIIICSIFPNTFLNEMIFFVLPILLSFTYTELADKLFWIYWGLGAFILIFGIGKKAKKNSKQRPQLDVYRGSMMLMCCLAIFSVDFKLQPRNFAKTETFGTSVMDIGVACVVMSAGMVTKKTGFMNLLNRSWPLIVLGAVRVVLVKGSGYIEHVSEYGVHWNFFVTLSVLPLALAVATKCVGFSRRKLLIVGIAVGVFYQCLLQFTTLQEFLLDNDRSTLLAMNKEGIFSVFGYISLYFLSIALGGMILESKSDLLFVELAGLSFVAWTVYFILTEYFQILPSRRFANLSFVCWSVAFSTFCLIFVTAVNDLMQIKVPRIIRAINYNQLVVFLIANALTGIVNLNVKTLHVSDFHAFLFLVGYLTVLCATAIILYNLRIRIK